MNFNNNDPAISSANAFPPFGVQNEPVYPPLREDLIDSQTTGLLDVLIDSLDLTPQQFSRPTTYEASPQMVVLPSPNPDAEAGPQPYGAAEQRLVKKFFSEQVLNLLKNSGLSSTEIQSVYDAIINGKTLTDPALKQVAEKVEKQATDATRTEARLPAAWNIRSTVDQDWTPSPLAAYNAAKQGEILDFYHLALQNALKQYLSDKEVPEEQAALLQQAVQTGVIAPAIAEAFKTITDNAIRKTQTTYGLPVTWSPTSTDVENWKPVNLGLMTPAAIAGSRLEMLFSNIEELGQAFAKAAKKTSEELSPNDPNQLGLLDFIQAIAQAIREFKAVLREMQIKDVEKSKELSLAKYDKVKDRQELIEENQRKRAEMHKKQSDKNKLSDKMKIVGIVVTALTTAAAAAVAISTFGLGAPLVIASITMGVAMTSYTIADSQLDLTAQGLKALNTFLEERFPDEGWKRDLVKFSMIAGIVVIGAVAATAAGGAAASAGAQAAAQASAQTASQTAKQAILELIKQLSTQASIMALMASNVLPESFCKILIATGAIDENDEKGKLAAQMVMMAVTMFATIAVSAAASKKASGTESAASVGIVQQAKEACVSAYNAASRLLASLKESLANFTAQTIETIKKMLSQLQKLLVNAANMLRQIPEIPANLVQGLARAGTRLMEVMRSMGNTISRATLADLQAALEETLASLQTALQNLKHTTGAKLELAIERVKTTCDKALQAIAKTDLYASIKEMFEGYANLVKIPILALAKQPASSEIYTSAGASIHRTFQITGLSIQMATGISQGILALKLKDMLEQVGEIEYQEELAQSFIQLLEQLVGNFQSSIDDTGEFMASLQTDFNNLLSSANLISSKLFHVQG